VRGSRYDAFGVYSTTEEWAFGVHSTTEEWAFGVHSTTEEWTFGVYSTTELLAIGVPLDQRSARLRRPPSCSRLIEEGERR
jgi:hypothetical protein